MNAQLEEQFKLFAKFGDTKADGKTITLSQIDKWLKQAGVFDKKITTTDTAIIFNKFKSKTINYANFVKFIEDLAKTKNLDNNELIEQLINCGQPGMSATKFRTSKAVDRLTDSAKYTGAHRERFDSTGKGKGKEGREDAEEKSGYVSGYQNKDTYDKTH